MLLGRISCGGSRKNISTTHFPESKTSAYVFYRKPHRYALFLSLIFHYLLSVYINCIKRWVFQLDQFHEISSYLVTNFKYIFLFAYEKVHQWIESRFRGHKIESRNQIHSAFNVFLKEGWITNKAKTIGNKPNSKRKLKGTFPEE